MGLSCAHFHFVLKLALCSEKPVGRIARTLRRPETRGALGGGGVGVWNAQPRRERLEGEDEMEGIDGCRAGVGI